MSLGPNWQGIPGGIKSFGGAVQTPQAWPRIQRRSSSLQDHHHTQPGGSQLETCTLFQSQTSCPQPRPAGSPRQTCFLAWLQLIGPIEPHDSGPANLKAAQVPRCSLV